MKNRSDEDRERRRRLLLRSVQNLGGLPANPTGGAASAPAPEHARESDPAPRAEDLSPIDREQARAIRDRLHEMAQQDFFERLDVARDASPEEVKASFSRLVEPFLPDRLPRSLQHLVSDASGIVEGLRQACETLSDRVRRLEYLRQLEHGTAGAALAAIAVSEVEQAIAHAKEGEALLDRGEFEKAEAAFGRAHQLHPQAEYLAAQAWALYRNPSRAEETDKVKSMLMQAIHLDENCDRAYYQYGKIAKAQGDLATARRCFRQALKANPRHADARAEVDSLAGVPGDEP